MRQKDRALVASLFLSTSKTWPVSVSFPFFRTNTISESRICDYR